MEITDHQISILESPFTSIWLGSWAPGQFTDIVRLTGARVAEDKVHLDLFVPLQYAEALFAHLRENKKISFLGSLTHTFEAYQVKGMYVEHRTCTEEEVHYQRAYTKGFAQNVKMVLGVKGGLGFENYYSEPSVVIRMRSEEIYEQTPKTGTGNKIS